MVEKPFDFLDTYKEYFHPTVFKFYKSIGSDKILGDLLPEHIIKFDSTIRPATGTQDHKPTVADTLAEIEQLTKQIELIDHPLFLRWPISDPTSTEYRERVLALKQNIQQEITNLKERLVGLTSEIVPEDHDDQSGIRDEFRIAFSFSLKELISSVVREILFEESGHIEKEVDADSMRNFDKWVIESVDKILNKRPSGLKILEQQLGLQLIRADKIPDDEIKAYANIIGVNKSVIDRMIKHVQARKSGGLPICLPDTPPELFEERKIKGEKIDQFLLRVWGQYSGLLTLTSLKLLDPAAYTALRHSKKPLPNGIKILTKEEANAEIATSFPELFEVAVRRASLKPVRAKRHQRHEM